MFRGEETETSIAEADSSLEYLVNLHKDTSKQLANYNNKMYLTSGEIQTTKISTEVISTANTTVVIQVKPHAAQDKTVADNEQEADGTYYNTAFKGFLKVHPKSLGFFQIIIGAVVFIFGILVTTSYKYTIIVFSGITYWGSFIYISAGFLSVAAENELHPCVVKASFGMNVFSAITAGIALLLLSLDVLLALQFYVESSYYYRLPTLSWPWVLSS